MSVLIERLRGECSSASLPSSKGRVNRLFEI